MKTLIIDNYDSFTYNLYQYVAELTGIAPCVIKNDEIPWRQVNYNTYDGIIISPGPGRPENEADFGISKPAILQDIVPVFGVCLGHQGIGHLFGAQVIHAPSPIHGRLSAIYHNGTGIFTNIPSPVQVVRYHSLIVDRNTLSSDLIPEAETSDGLLMAMRHRSKPIWGIQFHPESIATQHGKKMVGNFLTLAAAWRNRHSEVSGSHDLELEEMGS